MINTITLIGNTNTGKTTLFNKLIKKNTALTGSFKKLTYDKNYGSFKWNNKNFIIIDTGGINKKKKSKIINKKIIYQSLKAIEESDIIFFIITNEINIKKNYEIIKHLINRKKIIITIINKIDIKKKNIIYNNLKIKNIIKISAFFKKGINNLLKKTIYLLKKNKLFNIKIFNNKSLKNKKKKLIKKIGLIGCSNVGKSTFLNCILKEKRIITLNKFGITRDNINIPLIYNKKKYILIDTAGINKNNKKKYTLEKFSTRNTLKVIIKSDIILFIIDKKNLISNLNLSLLDFIIKNKKSLIIVINKSDNILNMKHNIIKKYIYTKLKFINHIKIYFISALYNIGINNLFKEINNILTKKKIKTSKINKFLNIAIKKYYPNFIKKKNIKIKYTHIIKQKPLTIIIYGNKLNILPNFYKKYLINYLINKLKIYNLINIQFKNNKI